MLLTSASSSCLEFLDRHAWQRDRACFRKVVIESRVTPEACQPEDCPERGSTHLINTPAAVVLTSARCMMAQMLTVLSLLLTLSLSSAQAFRIPFWSSPSTDSDWTQSGLQAPSFCNGLSCPKFKISEITSEYVIRQYANSEPP